MIARAFCDGTLVFDRDAIVQAALRAHVERSLADVDPLRRLSFTASFCPSWKGKFQRGAFYNGNGCGDDDVVAWTETGVVGLAYQLGFGPIEQLGLSLDAVTGGPEDVRGAVPELPAELESAFLMAAGMLEVTGRYGETTAGVGFWLDGERVAGSLFDEPTPEGAYRLVAWGMLQEGRLPLMCDADTRALEEEIDRTTAAPIQGLVDALVARALTGPTELTTDELATLLPTPADARQLLGAQRRLQNVGITWPGSPDIPPEPRPTGISPFLRKP